MELSSRRPSSSSVGNPLFVLVPKLCLRNLTSAICSALHLTSSGALFNAAILTECECRRWRGCALSSVDQQASSSHHLQSVFAAWPLRLSFRSALPPACSPSFPYFPCIIIEISFITWQPINFTVSQLNRVLNQAIDKACATLYKLSVSRKF